MCKMLLDAWKSGFKPNFKTFQSILLDVIPPYLKIPKSNGYFEKFKLRNHSQLEFLKKPPSIDSSFVSMSGLSSPTWDLDIDQYFALNQKI